MPSSRVDRLLKLLSAHNIPALAIVPGPNMVYFTGLNFRRTERMHAAVLPAKGEIVYISPAFEVEKLKTMTSFGDKIAVDDVSLVVPPGQMLGILGRSGAGKSTLLRMINRLLEPTAGTIHEGATEVTALSGRALRDWRTACAMIFQQFNLIPRLDVLTNVLMGRLNHRATLPSLLGLFTAAERAMALKALERFDLLEVALLRGGDLSGGQQQQLAIGRALTMRPKLLVLDEPTEGIQPSIVEEIIDILKRLRDKRGLTIVLVEQNLDFIRALSERVLIIQKGRITRALTAEHLADPDLVHEFVGVGS